MHSNTVKKGLTEPKNELGGDKIRLSKKGKGRNDTTMLNPNGPIIHEGAAIRNRNVRNRHYQRRCRATSIFLEQPTTTEEKEGGKIYVIAL